MNLWPDLREVVLVVLVEEGVMLAPEEGLVDVHPGAVDAGDGLGHEGGVDSSLLGQFLDREAGRVITLSAMARASVY